MVFFDESGNIQSTHYNVDSFDFSKSSMADKVDDCWCCIQRDMATCFFSDGKDKYAG